MCVEFRQTVNRKLLHKIEVNKKPVYGKGIILPDGCYYKIKNVTNGRNKMIVECLYSPVIN